MRAGRARDARDATAPRSTPASFGYELTAIVGSIDELGGLLDRFLVYGQTPTSIVNGSPIARRDPPLDA